MKRIIAVVVSHNRHALLKTCIEALRNQTQSPDAILVVNNGSSDYTSVWLDKQEDLIHVYQDNKGSAGGFHTGIAWAMENHYDWIWCMDDDGYPKQDALEMLMQYASEEKPMLNCAVLNKDDRSSFVWPTANYKTIEEVQTETIPDEAHPFNGTLLHRSLVEKVGLPMQHLFYWGEEREYFYRILHRYQIPVTTITHSIQYHPAFFYSHRMEWDYQTSWKMYFYVRNRYQVLKSKYSNPFKAMYHYVYFLAAFCCSVLIYQKRNRFRKILFVCWPMRDAMLGRYQATPESIQNTLAEKYKQNVFALMLYPFRKMLLSFFAPEPNKTTIPA